MKELDLQFKIFTLVDTTKSYVILNESMNKLLALIASALTRLFPNNCCTSQVTLIC